MARGLSYNGYRMGSIEKEILSFLYKKKVLNFNTANTLTEIFSLGGLNLTDRQKSYTPTIFKRLTDKSLIYFETKNNKKYTRLTQKGIKTLRASLGNKILHKKWDNKWRVVIFDIKEERKNIRNTLRFHLKQIGFIKLQNSVWIFPYECDELVVLLKTSFYLGKEVIYMTVDSIENDTRIRKSFGL